MPEYIERDALKKTIHASDLDNREKTALLLCVGAAPAADVATVVHGRWEIVIGSDGKEHMVCTECRKQQDLTGVFSYCPNCGAMMDGEVDDGTD